MGIDKVGYEGVTREEYYRKLEEAEEGKKVIRHRTGLAPTTRRGSSGS
jgi:hypothetical protein